MRFLNLDDGKRYYPYSSFALSVLIGFLGIVALLGYTLTVDLAHAQSQAKVWWPGKGTISLVSLIANGKEWDGKHIETVGFAVLQFEGPTLYLSSYDAEHHINENGIGLVLTADQLKFFRMYDHHLVSITGTFSLPTVSSYSMHPNGAVVTVQSMKPHG